MLAGNNTEVVHREYGCEFLLDLAAVYFSPRLATERHRVTEQVDAGERAFDMFAGVGPFVIPFAKRGAECLGVDINADAIDYLRENARRNGVADRVTAINDDVRTVAAEYEAGPIARDEPSPQRRRVPRVGREPGRRGLYPPLLRHPTRGRPLRPGRTRDPCGCGTRVRVTVETRHTVRSYAPHELNVCLDVRLER